MTGIKAPDVCRDLAGPIVDDVGVASMASRFLSQLPGEDYRATLVAIDQLFDILLISLLTLDIGIPCSGVASTGCVVRGDTAQIRPIDDIIQNDLDVVFLGILHDCIEARYIVRGVVDI